jgi:aspartate/methionine/tyrosine aminotransferase
LLPPFRLEEFLGRWEFAAQHHLTASDAESVSIEELLESAGEVARQQFLKTPLSYLPSLGSEALRTAIAGLYEKIQPHQVICFAGAQEGLFCAFQALLDKSSHALVTYPNYQSMEELPLSRCGSVSGWRLRPEAEWTLDLEEGQRLLRPNTRLIAVNFPNNPTGKVLSQQDWRQLVAWAEASGAWLFSDEVYRGIERDPAHTLPHAADLSPRALSLGVMSKAFGLPGLRIGWVACQDSQLLEKIAALKNYLSICNSGPSEALAVLALSQADRLLGRNRELCRGNLALWKEFFRPQSHLFEWWEPEGSCAAFPRYLGRKGVEKWSAGLLERSGILFLPASIYRSRLGSVDEDRFRLGYGRRGLAQALAAWTEE